MGRARVIPVVLAVSLTAVVVAAASAHPPAPVNGKGRAIRGSIHSWIHQAKVPLVHGRVRIRRRSCPGHPSLAACVFSLRPRTLFLKPGRREPKRLLYHELGHVFDLRVLNRRERGVFKRIIEIRRRGWFRGGLPPAEWFADGYASCAVRQRLRRRARPTPYGYTPTRRQHIRVCRLIARAAAPSGRPPQAPQNPPPVIEVKPPPPQDSRPDGDEGCNLVDELLSGCKPSSPVSSPLP
jgi:hypothetical protein